MSILYKGFLYEAIESQSFTSYDSEYPTIDSVLNGLSSGKLLVHTRKHDNTDFRYGIEPSSGEFLQSTEAYQDSIENGIEPAELTFFSDDLKWANSRYAEIKGATIDTLDLIFVRKSESIQKSLGNGKVELFNGSVISYERSPIADYEDPTYANEPAGVETGDWYTNKTQDVVAVIPVASIKSRL